MAGCSGGAGELSERNDSDGEILSMVDVLNADKDLEEEVNAVLGDSDDKCCTFPQGYLGRQALYACETCCPTGVPEAAICLACSYACHEGHSLFELYTKRNVRCDCGNSKFQNFTCKLFTNKPDVNEDNKYNQNFKGLYCTCKRPYPDPEDNVADEMIQCILCEDWYHGRHLGTNPPVYLDYQEMVCTACMEKNSFLWAYAVNSIETKCIENQEEKSKDLVDIESKPNPEQNCEGTEKPSSCQEDGDPTLKEINQTDDSTSVTPDETTIATVANTLSHDQRPPDSTKNKSIQSQTLDSPSCSTDGESKVDSIKSEDTGAQAINNIKSKEDDDTTKAETEKECMLEELMKRSFKSAQHATFWPNGWRAKLCSCPKCKELYKSKNLEFLPDMSDTVLAYEERGKAKQTPGETQYDRGIQALSNMHRTQQIEVISEYNSLQSELTDFLRKFAEEGKVVQEEDIRQFFDGMQSRKRQRTSQGFVQPFCR
ncbi:putative E3 ubiquitin-protein ligase UBR7 [Anneissia japonica]|uniref:putative E3 ubiquitin-protein ligase UBR7 n=1 Tax=Anneissia japonica TaxID=1529436 RepID=UPI001425A3C1|nr:putative E3 ubiquitin-protein ligase UBR7 [Anneissia japonica]